MKAVSIRQVSAIIILDNNGKRIAVKYYNDQAPLKGENKLVPKNTNKDLVSNAFENTYNNLRTVEDQKLFESDITEKARKLGGDSSETEVLVLNKFTILYLLINDVSIYIVGEESDNEIILHEIMQTVQQCLDNVTNNQIGKKQLLDKLDSIYLILDEIADSGIIMETNPNVIINRLYMHESDLQEHTPLNQAISSAKENIIRSLLSGT
ncbi:coatomer subunit zeta, putative [Plasmodium knowlesi strain H]|uniref:Coatomer subunit zeta n=3 Tax=Plasmodium knowlesi TaxID=5850 RepID=A0A5K1TUQ7_PLAKH|nr:coatomer subunit zeta, putative [Plasmodium knowlesi strain H]OTN68118.1 putative Coatomer subunit zeta [Plasmodium knowlesi]CAA9986957.1 coatomer subunit zeta, putative [Plasmodium knowlesi strain H]SBO26452.1 coatomer subunit zeta, putative [Plasmodium knowlesi strain H]SBO28161.1 coatomer subunit zeta, putative [Plasmodium knowlesi strain H]VVS76431.1 coatomer subunit zeta, putative [Plasmodium knowlesi strain H]|eukprot:XP_002258204.1 nonclathrin coat protein zeta2 subunit,putative [Plasmodium knowlesi strain H]